MCSCLEEQLSQLKLISERLHYLHMHDAITILHNSFSIPKFQHILRTSPAFSSPLLRSWDHLMMAIVSRITNINFNQDDPSWLQATLPVGSGSFGLQSASSRAPSAFLASADGASDLCTSFCLPSCNLSHTMTKTAPSLLGRAPCLWTQLTHHHEPAEVSTSLTLSWLAAQISLSRLLGPRS